MARIRSIKPGAFTSESMANVSVAARWTFAGLWTYCDDEGFGKADPRLIKGQIWALDDEVTPGVVSEYLDELEHEGMICRFDHDGRSYLHVPAWFQHQSIQKPTRSKFPVCPRHFRSGSPLSPTPEGWSGGGNSTTGGLPEHYESATGRKGTGNREEEQGNSVGGADDLPESINGFLLTPDGVTAPPGKISRPKLDDHFEEFWAAYPNKTGKLKARPAWDKARQVASIEDIFDGAVRVRDDPKRNPKFTPHPTTWLNRGGWLDQEIASDEPASANAGRPADLPEGW